MSYKQANIYIVQIYIDSIVYNNIFLKDIFHYVQTLSALLLHVCRAQVFLSIPHTDVFTS